MARPSALYYFQLKCLATIIRSVVLLERWFRRNVLKTTLDWEKVYSQATREYIITSGAGRPIKIRVWEPTEVVELSTGLRPVHINFHGSGYMIPFLGNDSDFCQLLSEQLGITVLDCDYSKAPECPFPFAYNEVVDVLKHVLSKPLSYDIKNLTMGGFSAGAGLAACVAANERLTWENVKGLVLTYPPGDLSNPPGPPPKGPPGSTAPILSPRLIDAFNRCYAAGGYSLADPRISPLLADYTHFHGAVNIIVGEFDNLKAHGLAVGEKMKKEGLKVNATLIDGVGHAWDKTARPGTWEYQRKCQAYDNVLAFLRDIHQAPNIRR